MTPAMWLASGGALGAFVRMLADRNVQTWSRETAVQTFLGAVSMGVVGAIPAETIGQWVPGASQLAGLTAQWFPALLVGALGGYSGLDLVGLLARRFGLTWPPVKASVVLLAITLGAAGCVTGDRLSVPTLVKVNRIYGRLEAQLGAACKAGTRPPQECADLAAGREQLDAIIGASLDAYAKSGAVDPEQVQKALDALLKVTERILPLIAGAAVLMPK